VSALDSISASSRLDVSTAATRSACSSASSAASEVSSLTMDRPPLPQRLVVRSVLLSTPTVGHPCSVGVGIGVGVIKGAVSEHRHGRGMRTRAGAEWKAGAASGWDAGDTIWLGAESKLHRSLR